MRYAQVRNMDISNGEGIGVSLWTQGCDIRCPGCHNASIWNFADGYKWTGEKTKKLLPLLSPNYIVRFSILGGEPTAPCNQEDLSQILKEIKRYKPSIKCWLWSGHTWEWLQEQYGNSQYFKRILSNLDILVDGPYLEAQRDITLKFKGSANQRLIDVPATLESGKVILAAI